MRRANPNMAAAASGQSKKAETTSNVLATSTRNTIIAALPVRSIAWPTSSGQVPAAAHPRSAPAARHAPRWISPASMVLYGPRFSSVTSHHLRGAKERRTAVLR